MLRSLFAEPSLWL